MGLNTHPFLAATAACILLSSCGGSSDNTAAPTKASTATTSSTASTTTATSMTRPETTNTKPEPTTTTEAPQPTIPDIDRNTGPGGTNIFGEEWLDDDLAVLAVMDEFFDRRHLTLLDPNSDLNVLTELMTSEYAEVMTERLMTLREQGLRVTGQLEYEALYVEWRDYDEVLVISCFRSPGTWETNFEPDDGIVLDPYTGGVLLTWDTSQWLISGLHSEGSEPCAL